MKKIALILGVLLVSLGAFAQEKSNMKQSDLTGPDYKNYKHWMHKTEPVKIYSETNTTTLQGPAYKNQQPGTNNSKKELVEVKIGGSERQKLTGPAYKNHGPWNAKTK
ncbi:hypothetical protein [Flavobacterium eburneipallidum]|uniref:hypothetical protein n=1 Tax=Flavobacterium eburneipallidum TaxID=3003263 RepID=UPI0024827AF8|nr:hypothetical protein [Flavobacterium eburneipallidum]